MDKIMIGEAWRRELESGYERVAAIVFGVCEKEERLDG